MILQIQSYRQDDYDYFLAKKLGGKFDWCGQNTCLHIYLSGSYCAELNFIKQLAAVHTEATSYCPTLQSMLVVFNIKRPL